MVKKTEALALVPGNHNTAIAAANDFLEQLPDKSKLKRISSPQLMKCEHVPIGGTISGIVTGLVQNLAKSKDMKNALVIQLHHTRTDRHFMFPMTGTIRASLVPYLDETNKENIKFKTGKESIVGKLIFITRREDGKAKRYGGNRMFNFDVDVMD